MTGLLERLERDGLVARSPDAQDRRREMVLLTSRGRKLLNKVMPDFYQRVAAIMEGLTAQEQRSLIDVLYRIRQRIDAMTNPSMTAKKSDARADNPAR
jgi:DNA-binding MarR family transcriptional regulator